MKQIVAECPEILRAFLYSARPCTVPAALKSDGIGRHLKPTVSSSLLLCVYFASGAAVCGCEDCGCEPFGAEPGVFAPFGVTVPSGATVSPYRSLRSPGGAGLFLLSEPWLLMLGGCALFVVAPGVFVPFGVTVPSGATVSPYLSLWSPGGVGLLVC
jgi:hypothetical protein